MAHADTPNSLFIYRLLNLHNLYFPSHVTLLVAKRQSFSLLYAKQVRKAAPYRRQPRPAATPSTCFHHEGTPNLPFLCLPLSFVLHSLSRSRSVWGP
jgi:hypothetical protein